MSIAGIFKDALKFSFSNNKLFITLSVFSFGYSTILGAYSALMIIIFLFPGLLPNLDVRHTRPLILLVLLGLLFLSFVLGYQIKAIKTSMDGHKKAPAFNLRGRSKDITMDGLKTLIAGLTYMIIPLGIYVMSLMPLIASYNQSGNFKWQAINWTLMSIGLVLMAILYGIFLMGKAHMAHKGDLKSAFQFKEIFGSIKHFGLINYVLFIIILLLIEFLLVLGPIWILNTWGIVILGLLVLPFLALFESRAIALVYRPSLE